MIFVSKKIDTMDNLWLYLWIFVFIPLIVSVFVFLVVLIRSPFKFPYHKIVFDVSGAKKPRIEERKKALISKILTSLQEKHKSDLTPPKIAEPVIPNKHLFFIKENGVCDAKGYYDEKTQFFFICKDSLVSYDTDLIYLINDTENARDNFLKKICEEEKGFYRVVRDAKCRSASAAACYVIGYL